MSKKQQKKGKSSKMHGNTSKLVRQLQQPKEGATVPTAQARNGKAGKRKREGALPVAAGSQVEKANTSDPRPTKKKRSSSFNNTTPTPAASTAAAALHSTSSSPSSSSTALPASGFKPGLGPPGASPFLVSSNWKQLLKQKPEVAPEAAANVAAGKVPGATSTSLLPTIVALDCEMVGVGPGGATSILARLSIVDAQGKVLVDKIVKPSAPVTDYRTSITGITAEVLKRKTAISLAQAQRLAEEHLKDKVIVGHALKNDFKVLNMVDYPQHLVRDTALFKGFRDPANPKKCPSLAGLCQRFLQESLHSGSHDSVEDARMALRLYRLKSKDWEKEMKPVMEQHRVAARASSAAKAVAKGKTKAPVDAAEAAILQASKAAAQAEAAVQDARKEVNPNKKKRKRLAALEAAAAAASKHLESLTKATQKTRPQTAEPAKKTKK